MYQPTLRYTNCITLSQFTQGRKTRLTGTFPSAFSVSLFSNNGALLLLPPISTARGSGFSWRLAADGEDGARGGVSSSSPELRELLAVVDKPVMEKVEQLRLEFIAEIN